jgi:cell division septation protein DedD
MCFLLQVPEEIQKAKAAKPEPKEVKPAVIRPEIKDQRPDPAAKPQTGFSKPEEVQEPVRKPVPKPKPAIKQTHTDKTAKPEHSKPEPTNEVAPKETLKTGIQALLSTYGSSLS